MFALPKGGYFRVAVWGRDEQGRPTSASDWLWVAEHGTYEYNHPTLEVLTGKRRYRIGETVQVLVNTNRKNVWALVTVKGQELSQAFCASAAPINPQLSLCL